MPATVISSVFRGLFQPVSGWTNRTMVSILNFCNHIVISRLNSIKSPGEALSTFSRASRDPKGETQLRVVKSTKMGLLTPKTKPKHFPNKSKTTLKKSRNRLFWPPKWSKLTPQIGQNEQNLDWKSRFSRSIIDLLSWKLTLKCTF